MKTYSNIFLTIIWTLILSSTTTKADNFGEEWIDWRENMNNLIYSPQYFGPNAFPIPELKMAKDFNRFEVEVRGDYHDYVGDRTKDIFTRALLPIVKGRAALEVSFIAYEEYKLTHETQKKRRAAEIENPYPNFGDVIINSYFQVLNSEKWVDASIRFGLKTASGGRLSDARFTDAASYWTDAVVGRNIVNFPNKSGFVRVQLMGGFYCWMTNNMVYRQNDAILYGGGFLANYKFVTVSSDYSGFHGYQNNGDRPSVWRNNLKLEYKKNILSLQFNYGIRDNLYNSYSVGYIRCF